MVKLRLKRFGRKNHAFWRINAVDHRAPRDGKVIEELGFYDPVNSDTTKQVLVNKARVEFWIKQARPTLPHGQTAPHPRHRLLNPDAACGSSQGLNREVRIQKSVVIK